MEAKGCISCVTIVHKLNNSTGGQLLSYIKIPKGLQLEARFADTGIIHLIYYSTVCLSLCITGNVGIRFTRDKNAHPKRKYI